MLILALDPGPTQTAFVSLDSETNEILNFGIEENHRLIERLNGFQNVHLVIEMIASYGMAVGAEVFDTCVWIGRFIQKAGLPYTQIYRKDVKLHLCGTTKAKDANIRQALIDRFGPQGTKKKPGATYGISKDVWAALAVAVTYSDGAKV